MMLNVVTISFLKAIDVLCYHVVCCLPVCHRSSNWFIYDTVRSHGLYGSAGKLPLNEEGAYLVEGIAMLKP